jgi:hypothetical protein
LELTWRQPKICSHVRGFLEALGIINCRIEGESCDRPDSRNVHEAFDHLDAMGNRVDFLGQRSDGFNGFHVEVE